MSVSYKDSNVIGGPIDERVFNQLKARAKILDTRTHRTDNELMYLNSTTGWVKLTSSVNTPDNQEQDAKNFTLLGGVLRDKKQLGGIFNSADNAYKNSDMLGYRPMAGITSFDVDTPSTFGTLRTATVNFKANSIEDLDILEQLYMRPGFSILLEWGHSLYIDNKGDLQTNITTFPNFFNSSDANSIYEKIKELKAGSYNNYDAMYGFIKNFVWSFNLDGGYDCKVDIVAQGELIQSLQIALATARNSTSKEGDSKVTEVNYTTPLHEVLHIIRDASAETPYGTPKRTVSTGTGYDMPITNSAGSLQNEVNNILQKNVSELYSKVHSRLKENNRAQDRRIDILSAKIHGKEPVISNQWAKYITLGTLLELINEIFTIKDHLGNPLAKFNTNVVNTFLTFDQHFALDPLIAILPKKSTLKTEFKYDISRQVTPVNGEYNDVLNILLNVNYILEVLNRVINSKEITVQTVVDVLNQILRELASTLGGINEFDLHNDGEGSDFYVVDRRVTPAKKDLKESSKLDLVGLKSSLENITMASKLSSNTTSMIAISSMASSSNIGKDTLNIQKWSLGLKDRHAPTKTVGTQPLIAEDTSPLEQVDINRLRKYLDQVNTAGSPSDFKNYDSESILGLTPLHRQFTVACLEELTKITKTSPAGLIPFELSFTIQGIGGLKVGQAIVVDDKILPKRYRGEVAFIITGVKHTIKTNRWVTDVRTQMTTIGTFEESKIESKLDVDLEELIDIFAPEYTPPTNPQNRLPITSFPRVGTAGEQLIKSFEKFEPVAYPDPVSKGKPVTIGWGSTVNIKQQPFQLGDTITPGAAEFLFFRDTESKVAAIKKLVKVPLTQNEFDALVSFTYNVGEGNLQSSTLLRLLNQKRYIAAAQQFLVWDGKGDLSIPGLVRRRTAEKELFLSGNPGDPS